MKKNKTQKPDWDDGRVISNMNVPGMPWYKEEPKDGVPINKTNKINKKDKPYETNYPAVENITDIILGGLGAALLVGLILCAGIVLFVLLCVMFL